MQSVFSLKLNQYLLIMPWTIADVDEHKSGLSDQEKRQWVRIANSALRRCKARGGSNCDASAIRQANGAVGSNKEGTTMILTMQSYVQTNSDYTISRENYQGKPHIVVPVVMMVEGVHSGSHGPILHLAEELGAFPGAWNGIPITVQHPEDEDGNFISANSPEIIRNYAVGIVFNTRMEGNKLKADLWIDEQLITAISPSALGHIMEGKPLEVSIGVFSEDEEVVGEPTYNGETYNAISRNPRPDHLALLPGGVGACSWEDGCGVRANKKGGKNEPMKNENGENAEVLSKEQHLTNLISNAESGYREVMQTIQSKLDAMDTDLKGYYLEDVFPDYFVYTVRSRENGTPPKLYKRNYSVNDNGEIEFVEESVEVRKQTSYVTFAGRGMVRTNINLKTKEVTTMSDTKKPCDGCEALVNALIANAKTKWEESDREWLMTLEENQLTKFVVDEKKPAEKPKESEAPQVNAEEALKIVKDSIKTSEDFMKLVPDDLKESIDSGLRLHQEARARMIKSILDNTEENVWKEEDLKAMKIEVLEKVFKSVVHEEVADYSLNGLTSEVKTNVEKEEPLMIVGYDAPKQKEA
jgi:hypothetical protein